MTLKEMIIGSLQQLDRNTDSQTVELWRDKLTQYINDAMVDLANTVRLTRTDTLMLVDEHVDTLDLPRTCLKVLAIERDNKRVGFYYGGQPGRLHVPGVPDGPVELMYRNLPLPLAADTDVPELPAYCHGTLISYVVGRERAGGDNMSINAARGCFEIYNAGKRAIGKNMGEADAFALVNCF